ncbi:uncharacterized protein DSM5745_03981 [Aspergillus mulundensis]|uniref:Uncharacterized protein n=1 Tax=Aspergillus mulundensis TaxID=1810919 RepID=A0A3D8SBE7_9EURO|nr:hypothetical protein DSM5745_03981 [Aspergillus mulundensis]RDW83655.1 hypothetical protein DSM5745_03981 [Aspergillus mulundensis]
MSCLVVHSPERVGHENDIAVTRRDRLLYHDEAWTKIVPPPFRTQATLLTQDMRQPKAVVQLEAVQDVYVRSLANLETVASPTRKEGWRSCRPLSKASCHEDALLPWISVDKPSTTGGHPGLSHVKLGDGAGDFCPAEQIPMDAHGRAGITFLGTPHAVED